MKKLIIALLMIMTFGSIGVRAEKYVRDANVLPVAAKEVLKKNFKAEVSIVKIDKKLGSVKDYDVILTDGSEITFDSKGNWKEVEVSSNKNVPQAFILPSVRQYIEKNHKGVNIVGVEKDHKGYEVTLSNGVEMKFDLAGKFLKYDD